ncbi:DUF3237 domain-containing protein [Fodinicola feengrottensis]|uniref:DUF3237 domain-containing protein n=1 Tax=Fodinicola feengrottensis TaxID=435914 RepID=A0ABN2HK56_9ACTN
MPAVDLKTLPAVQLVPLFVGAWRLAEYRTLGTTPAGTRVIIEIPEGRIEGDRVNGRVVGGTTADWFLIGPDGTGTIDFRGTLETDDGATIYMYGSGRCDMRGGIGNAGVLYGAPRFETSHSRYTWLNRVQAVFRGALAGDGMFYDEYFELR